MHSKATFRTYRLSAGSHTITATYSGNSDFTGSVGNVAVTVASHLTVDAATDPQGAAKLLTDADLTPIVTEAIRRTSAGMRTDLLAALTGVSVRLVDLPDGLLGEAFGKTILIDRDAAGYGWFVDSTPAFDEEFRPTSSLTRLQAIDPQALNRIDLLTVVEHELGHIVGLKDLDAATDDLMSGKLATGLRRNPSHESYLAAALALATVQHKDDAE